MWKTSAVVSLILAIGILLLSRPVIAISPGFQGEATGIYGFQGQPTAAVQPLNTNPPYTSGPCYSQWYGYSTPSSASIQAKAVYAGFCGGGALGYYDVLTLDSQTNPVIQQPCGGLCQPQQIKYTIKNPSGPGSMLVAGQVNVYTFSVDFSILSGSSGTWNFGGSTAWYNIVNQYWNQLSNDPFNSTITGNAFEAPLYAVASTVQWCQVIAGISNNCNQGSNQIGQGGVQGSALTFYGFPGVQGICSTLVSLVYGNCSPASPPSGVNSTLSSQYAPDSRMSRLVYFPISLTNFQANIQGLSSTCFGILGCTYPSAEITFTLYTLQIGEYVGTNPNLLGLSYRAQSCVGLVCLGVAISNFFANPLNSLIALLAGGGILVLIILAASGALPIIVFALLERRGD